MSFSEALTGLWHNVRRPDAHSLTLRQVDLARSDFAAIQDDLEFVKAQLARMPTRRNLLDMAMVAALYAAGLVLVGEWLLFHR